MDNQAAMSRRFVLMSATGAILTAAAPVAVFAQGASCVALGRYEALAVAAQTSAAAWAGGEDKQAVERLKREFAQLQPKLSNLNGRVQAAQRQEIIKLIALTGGTVFLLVGVSTSPLWMLGGLAFSSGLMVAEMVADPAGFQPGPTIAQRKAEDVNRLIEGGISVRLAAGQTANGLHIASKLMGYGLLAYSALQFYQALGDAAALEKKAEALDAKIEEIKAKIGELDTLAGRTSFRVQAMADLVREIGAVRNQCVKPLNNP